jgi:predicted transposase/invertase (TIGR01784 family)
MSNINPRIDLAFKKIFGVEENKDLLVALINSIVSAEDQVVDITLLNPYNPKNFANDKLSILDIKAMNSAGTRFNIEIQITDEADYDKRALYYWAKLYNEQLQNGDDYSTLSKAIGIHILNFLSIPETQKYHNIFHVTERDDGFKYFHDFELHTIELKKFEIAPKEEVGTLIAKLKSKLDMWVAFLIRHDLLKTHNIPAKLNDHNLQKAINVLEILNFTDEERSLYDDHLKWLMIEANTLKKYENIAEERGRKEGEINAKHLIARNMLAKKIDPQIIAEITGLDLEIIKIL